MRLYPASRIILVSINTTEFLFQTEARRRSDVKEAVNALLAQDLDKEWLLVHSLSNGGARRVYNIAGAYRILTGKPLPARAYIMDSAPGIPQFRRDIYALSLPFKKLNWFVWIPAMAANLIIVSVCVCHRQLDAEVVLERACMGTYGGGERCAIVGPQVCERLYL